MRFGEFAEGIKLEGVCFSHCVFSLIESVFLLETDLPKGLLVFGVFTSTR